MSSPQRVTIGDTDGKTANRGNAVAAPSVQDLLRMMIARGGTDLHITADSPPMMRVHGELRALPFPGLSAGETKALCYSVLTENQRNRFEENHELDFSFGIRGLSRFRGNLFVQRGAVGAAFRAVPYAARSLHELGLPPVVAELTSLPRGLVLVTGPTGSGKSTTLAAMIDQDQPRAPRTHRHARGSDRVRPRKPSSASSTNARSSPTRTASPRRCATSCARIPTSC